MNIIRRRDQMDPLGMPRLLREFLSDPFFAELQDGGAEPGLLPLDISEREDELIVRASLPGYRKEDIDVQVHNGMLVVNAEHTEEHEEQGERFHRRERRFGSVSRALPLPSEVREDQCQAELRDGVLTLRLPKTPESRPRRIQITESGRQPGEKEMASGSAGAGANQAARRQTPQDTGRQSNQTRS